MKRTKQLLALLLSAAMLLILLAACDTSSKPNPNNGNPSVISVANSPDGVTGDENRTPLGEASGFTFDFETLEYAFTGAENAEFYYIRVFPVVNGQESNSASFQSDKIDADSSNSYSGVIEGQSLLAGEYAAHVVASAAGYSSSDIQVSGSSAMQGNPTLSATWNIGSFGGFPGMPGGNQEPASDEPVPVTADISITAADETVTKSYTLVVTNEAGSEVYRDDSAEAGSVNLTAEDFGVEELTVEDVYNVTVTVNQVSGFKVPAQGVTAQIAERRFGPPM